MTTGLGRVAAYLDDIIVTERAGNIIDANGRRSDPEKIQAITKMPRSNDIAQRRQPATPAEASRKQRRSMVRSRKHGLCSTQVSSIFAWTQIYHSADHKPLVSIFGSKKGLPAHTANRLLRWSLIPRGYDFKIGCRKTTYSGRADVLSRLIADQTEQAKDIVIANASNDADYECTAVEAQVPIEMKQITEETLKDETLEDLIQYVREDKWPEKSQPDIKCYFALRQSLSLQDDCFFFGPRIVIPSKFHDRVLAVLHDDWTNIPKDIENFVRIYSNCQEAAKAPVETELFSWTKEGKPWSRIHVDFAGLSNGKMSHLIVDAYFRRSEVIEMSATTSKAIIFNMTVTCGAENGLKRRCECNMSEAHLRAHSR
ncbi:hypothetical protein TELCIR_06172 [Teladorsagia circumcincta]|uniref:Uncharacterized protein n=1 Tax=Teladorsagia circumcincta TaxID=45464 RepID=A0A2G9UNV9_TELCI|nr:hypothetical protein TELCIR_06172 [Teladorsagia circumcincta]